MKRFLHALRSDCTVSLALVAVAYTSAQSYWAVAIHHIDGWTWC